MISDPKISYRFDLHDIHWEEMKTTLHQDAFDNGRTPEQLKLSFENSYAVCIAFTGGKIIGTVRALSDGVCNAYIVDVWTLSAYRHRGIATTMMQNVMERLPGQHIYLFTDDAIDFYKKLGFQPQGVGLSRVVGQWLNHPTR